MNAVDYNPALDQIVVSFHNQGKLYLTEWKPFGGYS